MGNQQSDKGPNMVEYFTKPLPLSVVFNSYISFFGPAMFYYFFVRGLANKEGQKYKIPIWAMEMIFIVGLTWLFSSWLSSYAMLDRCNVVNFLWVLVLGLINPAFMLLGILVFKYVAPVFQYPIKGIFSWIKDETLRDSFAIGFYLMLISWMGSIITYFLSIREGCKRSRSNIRRFKEEMARRRAQKAKEGVLEDDEDYEDDEEVEMVRLQ